MQSKAPQSKAHFMPIMPNNTAESDQNAAVTSSPTQSYHSRQSSPSNIPSARSEKGNKVAVASKRSAGTNMEEESIAIVSTNTSDASSISSLSGGSFSASSSSSSLLTTATTNGGKQAALAKDKSRGKANDFVTDIARANIDNTPVRYELSLSMYDGLLKTCRPFYFPSEREQDTSSSDSVFNIAPRLEDALRKQRDEEESGQSAPTTKGGRKRSSPAPLDNNDKYCGRKVRVKTISFQEPAPTSKTSMS